MLLCVYIPKIVGKKFKGRFSSMTYRNTHDIMRKKVKCRIMFIVCVLVKAYESFT